MTAALQREPECASTDGIEREESSRFWGVIYRILHGLLPSSVRID